jgi:hypothetical protein
MESLQDTINKLEARVNHLETKLEAAGGDIKPRTPTTSESIRMILMGPPGAGELARTLIMSQTTNSVIQEREPKHRS